MTSSPSFDTHTGVCTPAYVGITSQQEPHTPSAVQGTHALSMWPCSVFDTHLLWSSPSSRTCCLSLPWTSITSVSRTQHRMPHPAWIGSLATRSCSQFLNLLPWKNSQFRVLVCPPQMVLYPSLLRPVPMWKPSRHSTACIAQCCSLKVKVNLPCTSTKQSLATSITACQLAFHTLKQVCQVMTGLPQWSSCQDSHQTSRLCMLQASVPKLSAFQILLSV